MIKTILRKFHKKKFIKVDTMSFSATVQMSLKDFNKLVEKANTYGWEHHTIPQFPIKDIKGEELWIFTSDFYEAKEVEYSE